MLTVLNRVLYLALLAAGIGGLLWSAPPNTPWLVQVLMTVILYGPLLLFIPAILRTDPRQLTWLCFVLLFYFCGFTTQLMDPAPWPYIAALRLVLTAGLFVSAMFIIRAQASK